MSCDGEHAIRCSVECKKDYRPLNHAGRYGDGARECVGIGKAKSDPNIYCVLDCDCGICV
jgi:hypothetical protein